MMIHLPALVGSARTIGDGSTPMHAVNTTAIITTISNIMCPVRMGATSFTCDCGWPYPPKGRLLAIRYNVPLTILAIDKGQANIFREIDLPENGLAISSRV